MTWEKLLEQEQNGMLWLHRLQLVAKLPMPTSYAALVEAWGVQQPTVWMKIQGWRQIFPDLVRVVPSTKHKQPDMIFFEGLDSLLPVEPPAEPMVEKQPEETWEELPGVPMVEEEPEPIEEPPTLPPFIGTLTYDQAKLALERQGLVISNGDIKFNPLPDWNAEAQRGGMEMVVHTDDAPEILAVGRFDNGWLVSSLTMGADERG
jgi:hypothetical protein